MFNDGQNKNNIFARNITVTVNAFNDAPFISAMAYQVITNGTGTGPLAFDVGDVDNVATDLLVTVSSSNTGLVSTAEISIGGSGTSRTISLSAQTNQTGATRIFVKVSDPSGASATSEFTLTV